ncbi:hypothetical protein [Terrabacter sp. 2TAF16]|uniref:hypothetical protein n=2 Tax=unclassified Terrabacter TaxID=2630222 RepID=UPI003F97F90C
MSVRFNAPPGWPVPSSSWAPGDDWMPDPSWPMPPRGWTFWVVEQRAAGTMGEAGTPRFGSPPRTTAATSGAYGTDRGSWLAGLRARASSDALEVATSPGRTVEPVATRAVAESSWELDGLLTSAGRLDI